MNKERQKKKRGEENFKEEIDYTLLNIPIAYETCSIKIFCSRKKPVISDFTK